MKNKILLIILLLILLVSVSASNIVPAYIRGRTAETTLEFTFNFTLNDDCSQVIKTIKTNITTDINGIGFSSLDLTGLNITPYFLCEYEDDVLRAVHNWNSELLLGDKIQFNNESGGNITNVDYFKTRSGFLVRLRDDGFLIIDETLFFDSGRIFDLGGLISFLTNTLSTTGNFKGNTLEIASIIPNALGTDVKEYINFSTSGTIEIVVDDLQQVVFAQGIQPIFPGRMHFNFNNDDNNFIVDSVNINSCLQIDASQDRFIVACSFEAISVSFFLKNSTFLGDINKFSKDVNVSGNFTGNQIYGEMFNHTDIGNTIAISDSTSYFNITSLKADHVNGFSVNNNALIPAISGLYKFNWAVAFGNAGNNVEYQITLKINENIENECEAHRKVGAAGDVGSAAGVCNLQLAVNDEVRIGIKNVDGTQNAIIFNVMVNALRIGD